jgi:hypothetical protein
MATIDQLRHVTVIITVTRPSSGRDQEDPLFSIVGISKMIEAIKDTNNVVTVILSELEMYTTA